MTPDPKNSPKEVYTVFMELELLLDLSTAKNLE
jgi:hypothetical protein